MSAPVFLHYDREALDREYDNRRKVAEFPRYLARYQASSAAARERLECRLGVAYGDAPGQKLDVFLARGPAPAPVALFIHGGYWKSLSRSEFSFVAEAFAPAGVVTVVIDYALMPGVDMGELIRQCRAALAWTWSNAASIGGDAGRIHVSGHSAGGHLTGMLMATDWPAFDPCLPPDPIAGACGISGLYDLEPIRLCYLNDDLGLSAEEAARYSPAKLACGVSCPFLLPLGSLEGPEYLRQSQTQAAVWAATRPAPEVMVMEGEDHFSIISQLERPGSELARTLLRQMGSG